MNTTQVANLFRTYCDEPDESFLSTADVALYCKLGYDQFLAFIDDCDPYVRIRGTTITLANVRRYDLSQGGTIATAAGTPSVLGPNPNIINAAGNFDELGRMTRLVAIYSQNPASQLQILYNYEQEIGLTLANPVGVPVGQPGQSWLTTTGAIIVSVIDDNMQQWHDMIPLFAYAQYAIADAATSPQIVDRLNERKAGLREYLIQRSFGATSHVHYNADPSEIF